MDAQRQRLKFGTFIAPFHHLQGNPTLQLQRDLDLAVLCDRLGYDEVWFGEHHSTGMEIVASPELMIAAAAGATKAIHFGTGVVSLPYHHPLNVVDRAIQLDHMTRGRLILGTGPGKIPLDARMMGIDPMRQRAMQGEALEVILPLLRGEVVSAETDWFTLHDARAQLLPYSPDGIEVATASTVSPSGSILAGRHGLSLLSLAAGDPAGFDALDRNWGVYEQAATEHGQVADRSRWRCVALMFLAETREAARAAIERRALFAVEYMEKQANIEFAWGRSPGAAIDRWTNEGFPSFGVAIIGTPVDAIAGIERLLDKTGGFGTFLNLDFDFGNWDATRRSYELFAEEVVPHFRDSNRNRVASIEYAREHSGELLGGLRAAITQVTHDHFGDDRSIYIR